MSVPEFFDGTRGKSIEQVAEEYGRAIRATRGRILEDFHKAYVAHLFKNLDSVDLQSVCLVEHLRCEGMKHWTEYHFEYRPKQEILPHDFEI